MAENIKAVWKKIYELSAELTINKERLKILVEDVIGKRAETEEEANTVLSFLEAVDSKFKNRLLSLDEAIEEAKGEYKGEEKEASDEEVEKIGGDVEKELRDGKLASITTLIYALNWSQNTLEEKVEKKYGKTLNKLSLDELDEVIASLKGETEKLSPTQLSSIGEAEEKKEVADAEIVEEEEEEHWNKTVEIDEGEFKFREVSGSVEDAGPLTICKSEESGKEYVIYPFIPDCSCPDFPINKQKQQWCKHLKAAKVAGYEVKELPKIPEELSKELVKPKKGKAKKEEVIAMTVLGKRVEIPIQTPSEEILSEEGALNVIKNIIGSNPRKEDVLEIYAGIEEINADVVISLCQYLGIQYMILEKEIEKTQMSIGEIYILGASQDQIAKYGKVAAIMPKVDIVTRCKVTVAAAWKDKSGNTRLSVGVKEEYLTPHDLLDISKRGATFIETKAITKASKKALLTVLPVTHDGLKSKIMEAYRWN